MLREIGFFIVLLFPVVIVYLSGGLPTQTGNSNNKKKKRSNKKNKNKNKALTQADKTTANGQPEQPEQPVKENVEEEKKPEPVAQEPEKPMTKTALRKLKMEKKRAEKEALEAKKKLEREEEGEDEEEVEEEEKVEENQNKKNKKQEVKKKEEAVKEIDEHMDNTARYARVMRIQTEEEDDDWEAVPYEEGWSQVKARRPTPSNNSSSNSPTISSSSGFSTPSQMNSRLDRTAIKNAKKAQKKKEEKAVNDALQAARLRKHQKELEKAKIDEFYSTGKGKNTPWGKKGGSSKRPQATASVNENGSLIWD